MIRMAELAQLLALSSMREKRARSAVSIAGGALLEQQDALAGLDAAIHRHDVEASERESMFLQSICSRPVPGNELAMIRRYGLASDHRRATLVEKRNEAEKVKKERQDRLVEAHLLWRQQVVKRDKLAEIQQLQNISQENLPDASSYVEEEEMSVDWVQPSC